jgi:hypothetical protein
MIGVNSASVLVAPNPVVTSEVGSVVPNPLAAAEAGSDKKRKREEGSKHGLPWSEEDDASLKVMREGEEKKSWADITKCFTGRSVGACETRYSTKLKEGEETGKKGIAWISDDDSRLRAMKEGTEKKSWEDIAKYFPDRTASGCSHRYSNHLRKGGEKRRNVPWSTSEDTRLKVMGDVGATRNWADIAKLFTGRTPAACQVRYHSVLKAGAKKSKTAGSPKSAPQSIATIWG